MSAGFALPNETSCDKLRCKSTTTFNALHFKHFRAWNCTYHQKAWPHKHADLFCQTNLQICFVEIPYCGRMPQGLAIEGELHQPHLQHVSIGIKIENFNSWAHHWHEANSFWLCSSQITILKNTTCQKISTRSVHRSNAWLKCATCWNSAWQCWKHKLLKTPSPSILVHCFEKDAADGYGPETLWSSHIFDTTLWWVDTALQTKKINFGAGATDQFTPIRWCKKR